jgi:hypothetical protein
LTEKFKTDVRMLPQFGPLEGQAVDNPRGRDETRLTETLLGNLGEAKGSIEPVTSGAYQRTRLDRFGFPRGTLTRAERVARFQTADMVRAIIRAGKKAGTYVGGVAIRANESFNIQTADGVVQCIHAKHCELLARGDGYGYALTRELLSSPGVKPGVSRSLT